MHEFNDYRDTSIFDAVLGLAFTVQLSGYRKPREPIYTHPRFPRAKPIKVHQLSRHSFVATVDVPMVDHYVRVRGTTRSQTISRAFWVRKNYWAYTHQHRS